MGVLSTENRKTWSSLRSTLSHDRNNASCLHIVDNALFVVCLDDATPPNLADLCNTFLCGTYDLDAGVQIGTCTNRWYDKVGNRLVVVICCSTIFGHTAPDHRVRRRVSWYQF
jgi:carnitine O-acetyltransferase